MNKWIFAIFGYIIFRTPGAILGFLLGSLIQKGSSITINKITQQDFELNLLALASLVIKADGRVTQKELDFVRNYFISAYGQQRANQTFRIFNNHLKKNNDINTKNWTTFQ